MPNYLAQKLLSFSVNQGYVVKKNVRFSIFLSSISLDHSKILSFSNGFFSRSHVKRVSILMVLVLLPLSSVFLTQNLYSLQKNQTDTEIFDRYYLQGKHLFYRILEKEALHLELTPQEKQSLSDAENRYTGLYEHLMNFYYFYYIMAGQAERIPEALLDLSQQMAVEFIQSLHEVIPSKGKSTLESLLISTGYFSRKMLPIFRRYFRPLESQVKGQWALEELKVRGAHSLTKGKGVKLAIIDTGIDPTIKEIKRRIGKWRDFLDGSKPIGEKGRFPYDWQGHGTSIASVLIQIAPKAELMIVRVTDNETMRGVCLTRWSVYLVAAGMFWAAENGADIINLSFAFRTDLKQLREASEFCWRKNVTVVAAMANVFHKEFDSIPHFPAFYPWTIAVGGVEKNGKKLTVYPHSSKGEYIDIAAPASGIMVEMPSYLERRQRARFTDGNSFAVGFVSGAAALILSAMESDPVQKLKKRPGALVEVLRSILKNSASNEKLDLVTPNPTSGYGLIDIQKAVRMAKNFK